MLRFSIFYFTKMLYKFQAVPPPIIRSSKCTYSFWCLSNLAVTCCYHGWDGTPWSSIPTMINKKCLLRRVKQHNASGLPPTKPINQLAVSSVCSSSPYHKSDKSRFQDAQPFTISTLALKFIPRRLHILSMHFLGRNGLYDEEKGSSTCEKC
jgi:hypothetical protein